MKTTLLIIHWATYAYYLYVFGYASLFKVFQKSSMMEGMEAFGFGKTWALFIGYGELLGVIGLIAGLWIHEDRKSTRLNSSHVKNSYAVFCLKKKIYAPSVNAAPGTQC